MKKFLALLLCLLLLSQSVLALGSAEEAKAAAQAAYEGYHSLAGIGKTELLSLGDDFPAGSSLCDWTAFCIALLGAEKTDAYLSDLRQYASEKLADSSVERAQPTEWHRVALTAKALGADPTRFGVNDELDLIALGTYSFGGSSLGAAGLNGWIWALIALDCGGYSVPEGAKFQREDILAAILSAQEADGGFGLMKGSSDVDITAMALQALAPYREQYSEEIEIALRFLSNAMEDTGDYTYGDVRNSESGSQVIIALCALGIDPEEDERFIRNGVTLLDGLRSFRQSDGSYAHEITDDKGNFLASEQALSAWIALARLRSGQGSIFDLRETAEESSGKPVLIYIAAAVVAGGGAVLVLGRKKKHE